MIPIPFGEKIFGPNGPGSRPRYGDLAVVALAFNKASVAVPTLLHDDGLLTGLAACGSASRVIMEGSRPRRR